MCERQWTEQEERIFRMVHHDFDGLTIREASDKLGLSTRRIQYILKGIKKKAPQLFPILTKRENTIATMLLEKGLSIEQIAIASGKTENHIKVIIHRMKEKGFVIPNIKEPVRYTPEHDNKIKEKF